MSDDAPQTRRAGPCRPDRPGTGRLSSIALVALVAIVFGRVIAYGPINWDDRETIFANAGLRSSAAFLDAWTRPHLSLWVPVTHTFWTALASLAGRGQTVAAWPFRVASVALHATATLLVFAIARRLARGAWPAFVAAALFAAHPINVEAVAWISGQKDLLAGALAFAAILASLGPRRSRWHRPAAYALAVAAMLAKPQAVTVVAMLPLISIAAGDPWRDAIRRALPLLPVAIVVAIVARLVQPAPLVEPVSIAWRPFVAADAVSWYGSMLVWPASLAIDYGRTPQRLSVGGAVEATLCVIALAVLAWRTRRWSRPMPIGVAIALVGVAPVLGVVPFEFQKYSTVADHYAYASMLGVALVVAAAVCASPRLGGAIATVAIVACAARSFVRVGDWRDTTTLMQANLRVVPDSLAATRVLAFEASQRGEDAAAIALLRRAVADHDDGQAAYNLANALARVGDDVAARAAYEHAIARRPDLSPARYNFAVLLVRAGDVDEAERQLIAAAALDPRGGLVADALRRLRLARAATRPAAVAPAATAPYHSPP